MHPEVPDLVFANASGTMITRAGGTLGFGAGRGGPGEGSFSGTTVVAPDAPESTGDYLAALRAAASEDGGCARSTIMSCVLRTPSMSSLHPKPQTLEI